jgi:hypothetical protein
MGRDLRPGSPLKGLTTGILRHIYFSLLGFVYLTRRWIFMTRRQTLYPWWLPALLSLHVFQRRYEISAFAGLFMKLFEKRVIFGFFCSDP